MNGAGEPAGRGGPEVGERRHEDITVMYAVGPARPARPWVAVDSAGRGGALRGVPDSAGRAPPPRAPWGGGGVITTLPPINFHLTPRGPRQRQQRRRLKYWTAVEIKVNEYVGWSRYRTAARRTPHAQGAGRTGHRPPSLVGRPAPAPPREDERASPFSADGYFNSVPDRTASLPPVCPGGGGMERTWPGAGRGGRGGVEWREGCN